MPPRFSASSPTASHVALSNAKYSYNVLNLITVNLSRSSRRRFSASTTTSRCSSRTVGSETDPSAVSTNSNASNPFGARPTRAYPSHDAAIATLSTTMRSCGAHDPSLCNMTHSHASSSKNSSTNLAPRVPELKLSTHRTCARSNGAVVPPEVTITSVVGRLCDSADVVVGVLHFSLSFAFARSAFSSADDGKKESSGAKN